MNNINIFSPKEAPIDEKNRLALHRIQSLCHFLKLFDNKYFLLTEFEVRTVSYGPSFFPLIYGPSAKRAGHKSMGKNEALHRVQSLVQEH